MAKPAFIYAFDNLGPERFTELCGLLLASRFRGFLLGGIGPDGGVDAEIDQNFGVWRPESQAPLLNEIIKPGETIVFQFKHKVTARVGQVASRKQLLGEYKCQRNKKCELHRHLILKKRPNAYILVTNVEVNSEFRNTFITQCHRELPKISHYQIIGLDELEAWIAGEAELRHLYFPTIFGQPRFDLKVQLNISVVGSPPGGSVTALSVSVLNVGSATSYINPPRFDAIVDGERKRIFFYRPTHPLMAMNPQGSYALDPGRKQVYFYPLEVLRTIKEEGRKVFLMQVCVTDELDNEYTAEIGENLRESIATLR